MIATTTAVLAHVRETHPELDEARWRDRTEKLMAMDPEVYRATLSGRARANWRVEDLLQGADAPGLLLASGTKSGFGAKR